MQRAEGYGSAGVRSTGETFPSVQWRPQWPATHPSSPVRPLAPRPSGVGVDRVPCGLWVPNPTGGRTAETIPAGNMEDQPPSSDRSHGEGNQLRECAPAHSRSSRPHAVLCGDAHRPTTHREGNPHRKVRGARSTPCGTTAAAPPLLGGGGPAGGSREVRLSLPVTALGLRSVGRLAIYPSDHPTAPHPPVG